MVGQELRARLTWLDGAFVREGLVIVCDEQLFDLLNDMIVIQISEATIRIQAFTSLADLSRILDKADDLTSGGIRVVWRLGRSVIDLSCFNDIAEFGVELSKVEIEETCDAVLNHSRGGVKSVHVLAFWNGKKHTWHTEKQSPDVKKSVLGESAVSNALHENNEDSAEFSAQVFAARKEVEDRGGLSKDLFGNRHVAVRSEGVKVVFDEAVAEEANVLVETISEERINMNRNTAAVILVDTAAFEHLGTGGAKIKTEGLSLLFNDPRYSIDTVSFGEMLEENVFSWKGG